MKSTEIKKNTSKSGKRAVIRYRKGKEFFEKEVPASRSFIIADEYRKKTGLPVKIILS